MLNFIVYNSVIEPHIILYVEVWGKHVNYYKYYLFPKKSVRTIFIIQQIEVIEVL